MIAACAAHHRAAHRGRLVIDGDATSGWKVRHADGTSYGGTVSAPETEACAKAFEALRRLGFKESACRRALEHVRRDRQAHVSVPGAKAEHGIEQWLRAALGVLTPELRRC